MTQKFKITLISPYSNISAIGLRYISASLREAGWETELIFLPDVDELMFKPYPHPQAYEDDVLDQVIARCEGSGLVGITVMSNYFGRARHLTQAVHERLGIPVIWGGIHPTIRPEESLEWADYVCVGEGEEAIIELAEALANSNDTTNISNIATKSAEGKMIANPARPIYPELDDLPLPDYAMAHQFILHEGALLPMDRSLFSNYLLNIFAGEIKVAYMTSTTRGCPYRCTFCCDSVLAEMFPKWRQMRRRSPESMMAEINMIRDILPNLEAVMFIDSTFLAARTEHVQEFAKVYAENVDLPFFIMTTPGSIKDDKIGPLVEAGLVDVGMGIQSGSKRMRSLFLRSETNELIMDAGEILQKYSAHIHSPTYDLITDNPYETIEDKLDTLQLLYDLPRPNSLHFFSLTFYPGTKLYDKAVEDGRIMDDERDVYAKSYIKLAPNYYNFLLWCMHRNWPKSIMWPLIQPFALHLFSTKMLDLPFRWLYSQISNLRTWYTQRKHDARQPDLKLS